ncbi:hypothetical protein EJB05_27807 [Eragrostis curvula]|uniref:Uncharacterized protein n=1 Tax=Eragrostis curvula TaxID=38414 RepID=A0A5J9UPB6_9POAL|nr:hypothetical protein EJB05_27807 [Eragrostis curvula]
MASFTAHWSEQEVVAPARATPYELKYLSDIDNQRSLRFYQTIIEFFRGRPGVAHDPAAFIKSGLSEALVFFYPLAGRLREIPLDGRLIVECTAEGVTFVEADADVTLLEFGEPLLPPYPCVEELLCDLGDSKDILAKPLAFFQVTRFRCGGFSVGMLLCHTMYDAVGVFKFLEAIGDMARGEPQPTVLPVWERELLTSCSAPSITRAHLGYEPLADGDTADDVMQTTPSADMIGQYFFFGPAEISAIRSSVPESLAKRSTVFELLAAVTWRCRTAALGYEPNKLVRFIVTLQSHIVFPVAETTASELCGNPLSHALELVHKAKSEANDEYVRSTVELLASRKWPAVVLDRTFVVSDLTALGEDRIDFGWGKRIAGGVPMAADILTKLLSYFMKCKGADGEDCIVVPMYLPKTAMDTFAAQISIWTKKPSSRTAATSSL